MKKVKLRQGTLAWEKVRATRIGSSEIFDIVRYYSTDEELQNCGINAEDFKSENPFTSVWSLYHKLRNDGLYRKAAIEPENAEYGHATEPYGVKKLQQGRAKKLRPGEVYVDDRLIASLDIAGIAEEMDCVPFVNGSGTPQVGQRFVCEQKSLRPNVIKKSLPYKYIIQAQYQILKTKADFFILQVMVLDEDTPFIRGKICQMSKPTRYKYLDKNMKVGHCYFKNNEHLARLIEACISRFFSAVDNGDEPAAFIATDTQKNIIESIRENTFYNDKYEQPFDLSAYARAKAEEEKAKANKAAEMQKIIDFAKEHNTCRFRSETAVGLFDKAGRFILKEVHA